MISIMVVTHQKYVFYLYFLVTIRLNPVFARSVCPTGQYWEDIADTCLSCGLICQHLNLFRTGEKCVAKCPGYTHAPPVISSATPLQQTGTSSPPNVTDTLSMTMIIVIVLASIAILLIVLVVVWILLVRYKPNIIPNALCGSRRSPDQKTGPELLKNQRSVPASGRADDDEQRQILLYPLPTEETCNSGSDISNHSNPQQDLSAQTQCDASGCSESDTLVKEMEGSHPVPHTQYTLDETTPKSQVFSEPGGCIKEEPCGPLRKQDEPQAPGLRPTDLSDKCPVNELHDGVATPRSFVHQEEPDTLLKEQDERQTPWSRLSDGPSSHHIDMPYDHQPKQSSPSSVQGQSVLLLPGGQTYPIVDHMHDKMAVQVQDGAMEYEESSLQALNNTQPETFNPATANFSTHLTSYGSQRNQAVVSETENQLVYSNEPYPGEFAVHNSLKYDINVHPDSQYVSPIVHSQPFAWQSPDLTDVPSPSSMMHHHTVEQSQCLRNFAVPLTSMPTLPPIVEQTDSFS